MTTIIVINHPRNYKRLWPNIVDRLISSDHRIEELSVWDDVRERVPTPWDPRGVASGPGSVLTGRTVGPGEPCTFAQLV